MSCCNSWSAHWLVGRFSFFIFVLHIVITITPVVKFSADCVNSLKVCGEARIVKQIPVSWNLCNPHQKTRVIRVRRRKNSVCPGLLVITRISGISEKDTNSPCPRAGDQFASPGQFVGSAWPALIIGIPEIDSKPISSLSRSRRDNLGCNNTGNN